MSSAEEAEPREAHWVANLVFRSRWLERERFPSLMAAAFHALGALAAELFAMLHIGKHMYETSVGQQKSIRLADGKAWLNTDTRIRASAGPDICAVTLDRGQAYFDVIQNAEYPFIVFVGSRRISQGTKFAVQCTDDHMEVIVEEGKVRIDDLHSLQSRPVFADEGEIVVARSGGTVVASAKDGQISDALDWRYGILVFDKEALANVAAEFNRYNDRKISVIGGARDILVGGSFRANDLHVFANLMRCGFGLAVEQSGNGIIISE